MASEAKEQRVVTAPQQDDRLAVLTGAWQKRGIDPGTLRVDRRGTLRAGGREPHGDEVGPVRTLPALVEPGADGTAPQFEMGSTLGEGGMGVVRRARQTALGRDVAIKSRRGDASGPGALAQLLREARTTGAVEHPNVVPVYALGRDGRDEPLIVMKRIEGTSWDELLTGIADGPGFDLDGYLDRQLDVLVRVADAVGFAHSKGIVHRDLKPENVMIGAFGEIYVLDWGIAVGLDRCAVSGLPRARDVADVAGSPAYMAPEMVAADGASIDERTDVYLLGATLHQILTGAPPHRGKGLKQVFINAFKSAPHAYGPHVPAGLAEICHRAMSPEPEDRYPSAPAFGEAVRAFVRHNGSAVLAAEAAGRLGRLRELVAEIDAPDERQIHALYGLFSECRFGFAHALRSWDGNRAARDGLQRALELMIDFELGHGSAGAAAALLPELPEARPELAERVEAARRAERRAEARLAQLERDADLSIGASVKGLLGLVLSVAWSAACVACGVLDRSAIWRMAHAEMVLLSAIFVAALLAARHFLRAALRANEVNRRLTATVTLVFVGQIALWLVAAVVGLPFAGTIAIHMLMAAALWLLAAVNVDRHWWPMSAGLAAALGAQLLWPAYGLEWLGVGGGVGAVVGVTLRWRQTGARQGGGQQS
ncbi:MAG: serine/threonine protein kinase [Deltaproteobacteria bacterium]|nr:serine/threonine protein kinase [Deltaproteobacteria bacterium]